MAFFENLGKKAQAAVTLVGEKTRDVVDQGKASVSIMAEQREIEKNYRAIGEWFIAEYEGEIPEALRDIVDAVNASKAKIAELEAIKESDHVVSPAAEPGQKFCTICGAANSGKFCAECGAPMQQAAAPVAAEPVVVEAVEAEATVQEPAAEEAPAEEAPAVE